MINKKQFINIFIGVALSSFVGSALGSINKTIDMVLENESSSVTLAICLADSNTPCLYLWPKSSIVFRAYNSPTPALVNCVGGQISCSDRGVSWINSPDLVIEEAFLSEEEEKPKVFFNNIFHANKWVSFLPTCPRPEMSIYNEWNWLEYKNGAGSVKKEKGCWKGLGGY